MLPLALTLMASFSRSALTPIPAPDYATEIVIEEGWRFHADPDAAGLEKGWHRPEFPDNDWAVIRAGDRWEEQGFAGLDGFAWYRLRVSLPAEWAGQPAWLVLGGVSDACTVFCNGEKVGTYGEHTPNGDFSLHERPLAVRVDRFLRPGEENLLAVRIFDWGGSGGLWQPPCRLTVDRGRVPAAPAVDWTIDTEAGRVRIDADMRMLGEERPDIELHVMLFEGEFDIPLISEQRIAPAKAAHFSHSVAFQGREGREYTLAVVPVSEPLIGAPGSFTFTWPGEPAWPGEYAGLKVLNNFVTELLAKPGALAAESALTFVNPREGWVFLRAGAADSAPEMRLDQESKPAPWRRNPDTGAWEAMRYLDEGEHRLTLINGVSGGVDARAVPELAYCYYLANPHVAPQGPYDRAFLDRHVLPHVNALVASGQPPQEDFQGWLAEGRRWIANASLPGLSSETPPEAEAVLRAWLENPGVTQPGYEGLIVDEFISAGRGHYTAWTQAVKELHAAPGFTGRTFYAWCGDIFRQPHMADFAREIIGLDGRFVWEVYLPEAPAEAEMRAMIRRELAQDMNAWEAALPGSRERTLVCLGYMSAPPETLNREPGVDYNVFLAEQMHVLATDPAFWSVGGVLPYSASYADEEAIRWMYKLIRHYCIEGERERLFEGPYELRHVANPDFADGLDGWEALEAAPESITLGSMEGFSWLQGRYPRTAHGDQFALLRRSVERPNRLRQVLREFEGGKTYSLKLFAANLERLEQQRTTALGITLEGAAVNEDLSFECAYPSNYAHTLGPYNREHPAWITYYRIVFTAQGPEIALEISDWPGHALPADRAGEATAINFVEVQPYLMPE